MAISEQQRISLLKNIFMFRRMTEAQIASIVGLFEDHYYEQGERIFAQEELGSFFAIVFSGRIEVSRKTPKGPQRLAFFVPGDYFGEEALLSTKVRTASADAVAPTQLLTLNRENFALLLKKFPNIQLYLRTTITSRRLARVKRFHWVGDEETVYLIARKHPAFLYVSLIKPMLVFWGAVAFFWMAYIANWPSFTLLFNWCGGILLAIAILWGLWNFIDWGNDYYIVTNQRIVWLERVVGIYDSRQEAPLTTVSTVGVQSEPVGRSLGYGDVIVRTITGQIVMKDVGYYEQLSDLIQELLIRSKQNVQKEDTAALERAIRKRLGLPVEAEQAKPAPGKHGIRPQKPGPLMTFYERFFNVRIEVNGVVTYHKHLIVLLGKVWWQSLALLLIATAVVLRLLQTYTFISTLSIFLVAILGLLFLGGSWLYQYIDWWNDIYRVTAEQIIDINRKPLGKEDKKSAPLENILSLEHTRFGILGLLFNYGTVIALVGTAKFTFEGVYDPAGVEQDIFQRITNRKYQMREAESNRERERVADWLAAYHRQSDAMRKEEEEKHRAEEENLTNLGDISE